MANFVAATALEKGTTSGSNWKLPRVYINALDDQHLFELNVKLQYADEDPVVVATLQELAGAAVADFPPEAFLQRGALIDTVLSVVSNSNASAQARGLGFSFLQSLVAKLKHALICCEDMELLPDYAGVHTHKSGRLVGRCHTQAIASF
jgi:hypothetical protein